MRYAREPVQIPNAQGAFKLISIESVGCVLHIIFPPFSQTG